MIIGADRLPSIGKWRAPRPAIRIAPKFEMIEERS